MFKNCCVGRKIVFLSCFCVLVSVLPSCSSGYLPVAKLAEADLKSIPLKAERLENFYKVSDKLYRSAQPSREGFRSLQTMGVTNVLNLRNYHSDEDESEGTDLNLLRRRMNAGSITEDDLRESLKMIRDAEGPVLVHCWHGSDRMGAVCAAYRIVFENWSVESALDEMFYEPFVHHRRIYTNIPELIRSMDWDAMRLELRISPHCCEIGHVRQK